MFSGGLLVSGWIRLAASTDYDILLSAVASKQ